MDETVRRSPASGVPDSVAPDSVAPDSVTKPAFALSPRWLRLIRTFQLLSGLFAMLLVPLLWAAWSQFVLILVFCGIFANVAVFTALNYVLHRFDISPD